MLFGFLSLLIFLSIAALPIGAVTLALIWFAGGRISTTTAKLIGAFAFTVGPAYALWRMEWFDVWRHGTPSLSYLVTAYPPYLVGFAVLGWFAASRVARAAR
jgi:hypothetical protein